MLPRHRQILEYVRQHGDASVDALARVLGVTTQTIRRDIRQLEDERLLAPVRRLVLHEVHRVLPPVAPRVQVVRHVVPVVVAVPVALGQASQSVSGWGQ